MKVVMNTCWAGPGGTYRPGDIADVSNEVGNDLLKGRFASLFKPDKEKVANVPGPQKVTSKKKVTNGSSRNVIPGN